VEQEREYSKRLGVLSRVQLQAACDRFGLGRLIRAEPVPGGLFGQNVFLDTDGGPFVLRGMQHGDWQFAKERWFSKLVHDSGTAPVPWPYEIDESSDVFGWPYAVVARVKGSSGEQASGGNHKASRDAAFSRAAGTALGRLHQTALDACGTYDLASNGLKPLDGSYDDYVGGVVRSLIERCVSASSATTSADIAWAESILGHAGPAFAVPFQPTVIHLDYTPGNIVGRSHSAVNWEVTGIVDWMTAEAGDAEADLSRMLTLYAAAPGAAATFMAAYRSIQPERDGWRERFRVHMLLDRLLLWEYGQRNRVWFAPEMTMRQWIEPFTQMRVPSDG
jgi:hygromycin-B 7''-O-kinase